jgi:phospholipid/cholesterol/gamma-HCH transport system ATP-binding protein
VNVIEIEGLWTGYGDQVVHAGIDLAVRQGEVFTLVGGSGAGKTTLLRHMLGLEQPLRGAVRVFGQPPSHGSFDAWRALRRRWGALFQGGALYSALDVFDNIALPLRELGTVDEELVGELVYRKLEQTGLARGDADKKPAQLSGGMVKRVALARALILEPELLYLDEPTAGLDPALSKSFVRLIKGLRAALHLTVVMVTHDLDTLVELSDRVGVLVKGHLVALGTLEEIQRLDDPCVHSFFLGVAGGPALAGHAMTTGATTT